MGKHKINKYHFNRYLDLINMIKLPNRKKWLIDKKFCDTLKQELIKVFPYLSNNDQAFYMVDSTMGWKEALVKTCELCNVKSLIKYSDNLGWWRGDQFDGLILERMAELGVIDKLDASYFDNEYKKVGE